MLRPLQCRLQAGLIISHEKTRKNSAKKTNNYCISQNTAFIRLICFCTSLILLKILDYLQRIVNIDLISVKWIDLLSIFAQNRDMAGCSWIAQLH